MWLFLLLCHWQILNKNEDSYMYSVNGVMFLSSKLWHESLYSDNGTVKFPFYKSDSKLIDDLIKEKKLIDAELKKDQQIIEDDSKCAHVWVNFDVFGIYHFS